MLLPNYELLERIAESELSVVYKACHRKEPRRLLAVKVLKAASVSGHRREQFRQRIEHLRIVDAPLAAVPLAFGGKDGGFFVVREYFEGLPLDDLRAARAPLPLADFFTIACQLAETLDKVHEAGIVHGGVKPHNILVDPRTLDLRLIDFVSIVDIRDVSHFIYDRSFVREPSPTPRPSRPGASTTGWASPSDLYSLGVVLYELLTGRLPFTSDDPLELIHPHLAEEAPPRR